MRIHTQINRRSKHPSAVIVFAVFDEHFVWVRHPRRGWEIPGGKIEAGELPEDAAVREVFEESGAYITDLAWLAEYETPDGRAKWVYTAQVRDVGARPEMSETTDVSVFRPNLTPSAARMREDVSFIMKDEMYEFIWPLVEVYIKKAAPLPS